MTHSIEAALKILRLDRLVIVAPEVDRPYPIATKVVVTGVHRLAEAVD